MAGKKDCNCIGKKQFVVTPKTGSSFVVRTETEAKAAARRTQGSYKLK